MEDPFVLLLIIFIGLCAVGIIVFFFKWLADQAPTGRGSPHLRNQISALQRHDHTESLNIREAAMLPNQWDEIERNIQLYSDRPDALTHYVQSVRRRFVIAQDTKTAKTFLEFMRQRIEALQEAYKHQTLIYDLQRLEIEAETKDIEAQIALATQQHRLQNLPMLLQRQQELDDKRHALEMAELDARLKEVKFGKSQPSSPQDERTMQRARIEAEIERLKQEKEARAAKASMPEERVRIENMYDNKIDLKYQELSQYL